MSSQSTSPLLEEQFFLGYDTHSNDNTTSSGLGEIMATGHKITAATKNKIVLAFSVFAMFVGYLASTQPTGAGWRFFSWHPFLMIVGFMGMMGSSAAIKKLGGYSNTKMHGILSSGGLLLAFAGLYVIYVNKERMGKDHITTTHALAGIVTLAGAVLPAVAGGVFLHPDFGIDKTNQLYRSAHKWFGRIIMASAWVVSFMGLMQLTSDVKILIAFAVPLIILAPMTLV